MGKVMKAFGKGKLFAKANVPKLIGSVLGVAIILLIVTSAYAAMRGIFSLPNVRRSDTEGRSP